MDIGSILGYGIQVIGGLLILVALVVVHELGHAIAARRNGVVVEEFGIGFPPRAWQRRLRNGVLLTLNWLPLGGFVKLQGEHDAAHKKGDYGAASLWQKTKILLAGVAINWLTAAVLLSILALAGLPRLLPNQVQLPFDTVVSREPVALASLIPSSPAGKAGLKNGDQIIRFAGQSLESEDDLRRLAADNKGKSIEVIYRRDSREATARVALNAQRGETGYFGAAPYQTVRYRSTWSAPVAGVATTAQLSWEIVKGLGTLLAQLGSGLASQLNLDPLVRQSGRMELEAARGSVAGPVGILGIIFPSAFSLGFEPLVLLTAIVSLTLAVMNILPIPALDGGRWFVTALFRVLRRPLTKEREEQIHGTGFMVLMGLVVVITLSDVAKFF